MFLNLSLAKRHQNKRSFDKNIYECENLCCANIVQFYTISTFSFSRKAGGKLKETFGYLMHREIGQI
jgi:hypothetical protein